MKWVVLATIFISATCTVPALAAEEMLLCNLVKKVPTGQTIPFQQRYEIDFDTGSLISSENWGHGWQESGHSQLADADDTRITIADDDHMYVYIDRDSGNLIGSVLKDFQKLEETGNTAKYVKGTIFHGTCKKEREISSKHNVL